MIGWIIGGLAVAAVGLGLSRSMAKGSSSASPTATTPGYESQGGSLDGAIDLDGLTALSPVMQQRPANGQLVQIMLSTSNAPAPIPLQVVAVATLVRPDGSARIGAKMTSATIKALLAAAPAFAPQIPAPLQRDGMFVQFDASRVWGLGGMVPA